MQDLLQDLVNDGELLRIFSFHTNEAILLRKLRGHPSVEAVKQAWLDSQLTHQDLEILLDSVLQSFQPDRLFSYEYVLCALAYIADQIRDPYMTTLLTEFQELPIREMPLTHALVAQICTV